MALSLTITKTHDAQQGCGIRLILFVIFLLLALQFSTFVYKNQGEVLNAYGNYAIRDIIFAPSILRGSENNREPTDNHNLPSSNAPMNVVVIYPDDWRHDGLEDARPGLIHTPFLSQLAKEGIRFTHNAVTTSICWISRATLFSGRYASQHMSHRLACPVFTDYTWWQHSWPYRLMKEGGYWTGHVGKWQYRNNGIFLQYHAFNWTRIHEGEHWYEVWNEVSKKSKRTHAADRAKDDAIDFLRERPKGQPFAMTVAFYPPKPVGAETTPGAQWSPKDDFYDMYRDHEFVPPYNFTQAFESLPTFLQEGISRHRYNQRYSTSMHYEEAMKRYFALVSQVDQASQQIIDELKEQGVYNNTMIIVTADNGMMLGVHGLAGKWHPYEESIRVPLIIRDPRMPIHKRGTLDESFTLNIDLASTILGAAGLPSSPIMQGRDISDLYLSSSPSSAEQVPWRTDFFYEFPLGEFPESSAVVTKEWKYVKYPTKDYEQLFHLATDPYELDDLLHHRVNGLATNTTLSSEQQQILSQLQRKYIDLQEAAISQNGTDTPGCVNREYGAHMFTLSTF